MVVSETKKIKQGNENKQVDVSTPSPDTHYDYGHSGQGDRVSPQGTDHQVLREMGPHTPTGRR